MTAALSATDLVGLGIYTVAEAAMYAQISAAKLARWIIGTSVHRPAVESNIDQTKNPDRWVTFLDFVQTMAIRDIRATRKIPLEKLRQTVEMSDRKFKLPYPFAMKHTTWLFGDEIKLDIKKYGIIEATGAHASQLNFRPVIERYLESLSYDAEGMASGYTPLEFKGFKIVLSPKINFGEPMVRPGRHSVATLVNALETEGSYIAAAKAYRVKPEAVEAAYKYFYDYLRPTNVL
jgi:uncharacterized protein (DUF433 family)